MNFFFPDSHFRYFFFPIYLNFKTAVFGDPQDIKKSSYKNLWIWTFVFLKEGYRGRYFFRKSHKRQMGFLAIVQVRRLYPLFQMVAYQTFSQSCNLVLCVVHSILLSCYASDILSVSLLRINTTFTWLTSRIRSVQRFMFLVLWQKRQTEIRFWERSCSS